jgi:ABC-type sulfate/molybdate transport systems ATPase subunit
VLGFLRRAVDDWNQTVVMVTHDPVAASYADVVVFLRDGKLVGQLDSPTASRSSTGSSHSRCDMSAMLKLSVRNLTHNKLRFSLTTFAVLLGVSFVVASFVLTDGLARTFDTLVEEATSEVDVEVRAATTSKRSPSPCARSMKASSTSWPTSTASARSPPSRRA